MYTIFCLRLSNYNYVKLVLYHNAFPFVFLAFVPNLAEQLLISVVAADFDSSIPWLWTLYQSGNPCDLGAVDRCWLKFSLFPCNTQSNRSIARRIGHFMGCGCCFRTIFPKEILPKLFEWKQVSENHCFHFIEIKKSWRLISNIFLFHLENYSVQFWVWLPPFALRLPSGNRRSMPLHSCPSAYQPSFCSIRQSKSKY